MPSVTPHRAISIQTELRRKGWRVIKGNKLQYDRFDWRYPHERYNSQRFYLFRPGQEKPTSINGFRQQADAFYRAAAIEGIL